MFAKHDLALFDIFGHFWPGLSSDRKNIFSFFYLQYFQEGHLKSRIPKILRNALLLCRELALFDIFLATFGQVSLVTEKGDRYNLNWSSTLCFVESAVDVRQNALFIKAHLL